MKRSEHPATLTGQLRSFLTVPDNVLGVAQNQELLHRLDTAFFQVGEVQGGLPVKFSGGESASEDELRAELERGGLSVGRLEEEGRFRFVPDRDPLDERIKTLRELTAEMDGTSRAVWTTFDGAILVNLKTALRQQETLMRLVDERQLLANTAVLERVVDDWSSATLRQAQVAHLGIVWLSETGLVLSRVEPLPPG